MQHTVGIVGVRSCCNRATVHMLSAHKYPCPLSALEWQMMALHTLYTGLCTLCGQGRRSHPHVTIIELSGGDSSVITCTCFHDRPEPHISHGMLPESSCMECAWWQKRWRAFGDIFRFRIYPIHCSAWGILCFLHEPLCAHYLTIRLLYWSFRTFF